MSDWSDCKMCDCEMWDCHCGSEMIIANMRQQFKSAASVVNMRLWDVAALKMIQKTPWPRNAANDARKRWNRLTCYNMSENLRYPKRIWRDHEVAGSTHRPNMRWAQVRTWNAWVMNFPRSKISVYSFDCRITPHHYNRSMPLWLLAISETDWLNDCRMFCIHGS